MRALTVPVVRALLGSALESLNGGSAGGGGGLGPELLANGTFNAGATSWNVAGADGTHIATFDGATLRYQSDTTSPQLNVTQATPVVVGRSYRITVVVSGFTSGSMKTDMIAGAVFGAAGTFTFTGAALSSVFNLTRNAAGVDMTIDSISVRPVLA